MSKPDRILRDSHQFVAVSSAKKAIVNPPVVAQAIQADLKKVVAPNSRVLDKYTFDAAADRAVSEERSATRTRPTSYIYSVRL